MKINEIGLGDAKALSARPSSDERETVEQWLQARGFVQIGRGSGGSVWSDRQTTAVKVFHNDACYADYAAYCRDHRGNPHLPRISRIIPLANRGGIVFTERLKPLSRVRADPLSIKILQYTTFMRRGGDPQKHAFAKRYPALAATVADLMQFFVHRNCHYDVASTNLMSRNGVVVLTDPVTGE